MLGRVALLVLLAGCRQLLGFDSVATPPADAADGPPPDDADGPAPDATTCFGTFETICLRSVPTDDSTFASNTVNVLSTDDPCAETIAGTTIDACVLAGKTIDLAGGLRASGSRPFVVIATEGLLIEATGFIDVAVHSALSEVGAGGRTCVPASAAAGGGGGAGGSFGATGGPGGSGNGENGGTPGSPSPSTDLIGGCSGAAGAGLQGGTGGAGGGAVLVIAPTMTINGRIDASGGGGGGAGGNQSGGGGGGSGGLIVLDAGAKLTINSSAKLLAKGAGGGGGASAGSQAGARGDDPDPAVPTAAAQGGDGGDAGAGQGGNGGITSNGQSGQSAGGKGGGGGGGAAGVTKAIAPEIVNGGTVVPPFTN